MPDQPIDNQPSIETAPHRGEIHFLIVDDNPDGRFMLTKTLLRKYPKASFHECQDAEPAFSELEVRKIDLIVAHRTFELDGISLVRELRRRAPDTPIIMVSGVNRGEEALRAGADEFLLYDEWLMVGNPATKLLQRYAARQRAKDEAAPTGEEAAPA